MAWFCTVEALLSEVLDELLLTVSLVGVRLDESSVLLLETEKTKLEVLNVVE